MYMLIPWALRERDVLGCSQVVTDLHQAGILFQKEQHWAVRTGGVGTRFKSFFWRERAPVTLTQIVLEGLGPRSRHTFPRLWTRPQSEPPPRTVVDENLARGDLSLFKITTSSNVTQILWDKQSPVLFHTRVLDMQFLLLGMFLLPFQPVNADPSSKNGVQTSRPSMPPIFPGWCFCRIHSNLPNSGSLRKLQVLQASWKFVPFLVVFSYTSKLGLNISTSFPLCLCVYF